MISIAICEDIPAEQVVLKKRLEGIDFLNKADYSFFCDGEDLINAYNNGKRYDFVFLDVDMKNIGGIETGKFINKTDDRAIIIFVTSFPQYAIDAFDCNAFHYLLKSSDDKKLQAVMLKAHELYKKYHQIYPINTKNGVAKLTVSHIYYIECFQKHLYFHTSDGTFITKSTLSEAISVLKSFDFYQVHQGYIVNLEKIVQIIGNDILLDNGMKVMISTRKHTEVIQAYSEYISRRL